jgi:hypothetical protein
MMRRLSCLCFIVFGPCQGQNSLRSLRRRIRESGDDSALRWLMLSDEETAHAIEHRHRTDPEERNVFVRPTSFVLPTPSPILDPTSPPTPPPILDPTRSPTSNPSSHPSFRPSERPSLVPSILSPPPSTGAELESNLPSQEPSELPSSLPSVIPTRFPSSTPSEAPQLATSSSSAPTGVDATGVPTIEPSEQPSEQPSDKPSSVGASPAPSQSVTSVPSTGLTSSQAPSVPGESGDSLEEFLSQTLTDDGSLTEIGTPQNQAFVLLSTLNPELDPSDPTDQIEITERYALNTLYFATDPTNWKNSDLWATAGPPCGGTSTERWHGLICDSSGLVHILLPDNDLFGQLPSEIRGLIKLKTLDFLENMLSCTIKIQVC